MSLGYDMIQTPPTPDQLYEARSRLNYAQAVAYLLKVAKEDSVDWATLSDAGGLLCNLLAQPAELVDGAFSAALNVNVVNLESGGAS